MFKEKFAKIIEGDRSVCDIVFVNIIALVVIFLSAFLPFANYVLPILFCVYFEVGIFSFLIKKEKTKRGRYEDIFISLKKFIRIFCVFVVKNVLILFNLFVFIVPGIVTFLNYCLTPVVLSQSEDLDCKGVLLLSKELAKGQRLKILLDLAVALAMIYIATGVMFLIILFFDCFLDINAIFYQIFVLLASFLCVILFAVPYVEISISDAFFDAKNKKTSRK